MSEWVNDEDIHASKNPDKPPRLPYNAWLLKMGKLVENSAIKEAKTNDRKHKPVKPQKERKTIHWLEVENYSLP